MTCIYQLACFFYFCYFLYQFSYVTPLQKVDYFRIKLIPWKVFLISKEAIFSIEGW